MSELLVGGCTGLGDQSRDLLFGWTEQVVSPLKQHLEKTKFKPKWVMPRFNQYLDKHKPRGYMSCTSTNPFRAAACNLWLTVDTDDYKDLAYLAKEEYGFDFDTGNNFASGVLAVNKFLNTHFEIKTTYFNVWFNSDDFLFLIRNWFAVSVGYNVTTKGKIDVMDNNRIDTYDRGDRITWHVTAMLWYKVIDSNNWSKYEEYEVPETVWHWLRKYGDFYPSAYIHLTMEQIYVIPWATSDTLYNMASRLSYRYGKKFNDMQNKNYYGAEAKILEPHLQYDKYDLLKWVHTRLLDMAREPHTIDEYNRSIVFMGNQIYQYLWLQLK